MISDSHVYEREMVAVIEQLPRIKSGARGSTTAFVIEHCIFPLQSRLLLMRVAETYTRYSQTCHAS